MDARSTSRRRNRDLDPRRFRSQVIAQKERTSQTGFVMRWLRRRLLRGSAHEKRSEIERRKSIDIICDSQAWELLLSYPLVDPSDRRPLEYFSATLSFVPSPRMNYPLGDFSSSPPLSPHSRGLSWTSRSSPFRTVFNQRPFVARAKSFTANKACVPRGSFFSPWYFLTC